MSQCVSLLPQLIIMKKEIASIIFGILGIAATSIAGPPLPSPKEVIAPPSLPPSFFRANELDLGAFATYGKGVGDSINRGIGEHAWGGGGEVSYFPWLYVGFRFQGAAVSISRADQTAGILTGDVLLRYPLDLVAPHFHLAAYGFGGVGGLIGGLDGFDRHGDLRAVDRVLGNVGGGLEYRFTPHIGLFGEAGYAFVDGPTNDLVHVNWGLRFAF
jgi:hypothetical protein